MLGLKSGSQSLYQKKKVANFKAKILLSSSLVLNTCNHRLRLGYFNESLMFKHFVLARSTSNKPLSNEKEMKKEKANAGFNFFHSTPKRLRALKEFRDWSEISSLKVKKDSDEYFLIQKQNKRIFIERLVFQATDFFSAGLGFSVFRVFGDICPKNYRIGTRSL